MTMKVVVAMMMMVVGMVWGHGMLLQPLMRSSMWRDKAQFPGSPDNFEDNELFCGGAARYAKNNGRCGPCGDPFDVARPRPNEAGGKYGRGIIVETYTPGQMIDVTVRLTANHLGYFTFKLCPNNDVHSPVEQSCLDQHLLKVLGDDGSLGDRYYIGSFKGDKHLKVQLPQGLTCSQCVFQWRYNTGNSWGCFRHNGTCCTGCGYQENFVNCADVAIHP